MILKGDRTKLGKYVREMANLVGLRDWTVNIGGGSPDNDKAGADVDVTYGQKLATIRFRDDWPTMPPEDLRWLVVHELVHCHIWAMEQRACDIRGIIGTAAYEPWSLAFRHDLEHAVNAIASEWADTLPLPVKPKKAKKAKVAA